MILSKSRETCFKRSFFFFLHSSNNYINCTALHGYADITQYTSIITDDQKIRTIVISNPFHNRNAPNTKPNRRRLTLSPNAPPTRQYA